MLSQAERALYEQHRHEPAFVAAAALKSFVMLSFLALLAWIGVDSANEGGSGRATYTTAMANRHGPPENASARHRKAIFDERYSRWHVRAQQTAKAGTTPNR